MEYPVKFLSLQKTELEYEVLIRGSEPGSTVIELRKQIVDLGPKFPSEDITDSPLEIEEDLKGISDVLTKIKLLLDAPLEKDSLFTRYNAAVEAPVEDKIITPIANINLDQHSSMRPLNINVSCERAIAGELTKIKFDGKSCVRSFIQRITEFRKARDISSSKLLSYATEIFTGDALHWFRGLDGQDDSSDWDALLTRLKKDFDQTDYDYRLLSEIRARTQGENENITIYLSIMSGLFSRLSSELSNEDKLEILLHNIKPCYASTLASATTIPDIDTLRSLCRNYENIHARLANYKEPPRPSSETLAPEYAYNGHSSNRPHNSNQNYKPSSNVGNNYDRNRSYPNYRANVNKLNPNNYVHALHTSNDDDHRSWDIFLPKIQFAMNNSVSEATGFTPSFLVYGREIVTCGSHYVDNDLGDEILFLPRDIYAENLGCLSELFTNVQSKLWHAHIKNASHYNTRRKPLEFRVGDLVMKRTYVLSNKDKYFCKKLAPKFIKCRVIAKKSPLVYVLEDMSRKNIGTWHIKDLKSVSLYK
ncbi:retrotransposon gag protein domain-containing protein [Phthorimaea operculella]|nr:retrotransposon gag protein domain-containing protein [Phthorimaea operculella]